MLIYLSKTLPSKPLQVLLDGAASYLKAAVVYFAGNEAKKSFGKCGRWRRRMMLCSHERLGVKGAGLLEEREIWLRLLWSHAWRYKKDVRLQILHVIVPWKTL